MSVPVRTVGWEEPIPIDELLADRVAPATAAHLEDLSEHVDTDFGIADNIPHESTSGYDNTKSDEKHDSLLAVPKIVASGNSEAMQLQPIVDKIIELSGSALPKLVYIGTASFDRTDKFLQNTETFREMGCEIRRLEVSEDDTVPSINEMREIVVDWAEVILCSGGNTLHALLRWKEVGLDMLMKEAGMKGTVLCGGSAGAGCWFSSLHTDSLRPDNTKNKEHVKYELSEEELSDWDYTKISALGFIDAMCVPHYDAAGTNGETRADDAEKMMQEKESVNQVIGVDNNAAFVMVGNETSAVSGDGKATCHVLYSDENTGETISTPMRTHCDDPSIHINELLSTAAQSSNVDP